MKVVKRKDKAAQVLSEVENNNIEDAIQNLIDFENFVHGSHEAFDLSTAVGFQSAAEYTTHYLNINGVDVCLEYIKQRLRQAIAY